MTNFTDVQETIREEEVKLRRLENRLKIQEINLNNAIVGGLGTGNPLEKLEKCLNTIIEIGAQREVVKKYRKFLAYLEER